MSTLPDERLAPAVEDENLDFLCFQEIFPCTDASCIKLIFSAEGAKNLSVYGLVHRCHLCVPSVLALGPWQDLTLLFSVTLLH